MRVLAISAHPDDETLGCGGTLLKHKANGDEIYWMIATQSHEPQWSAECIERKAVEVDRVAEAYGIKQCFRLGLPTVRLDTIPQNDLIEHIREVISEAKPEVVYLVHCGDVHTDHQAVFTATMAVLKPFYMARFGVRRVLSYEVLSSTDAAPPHPNAAFTPNVFSDITPHIEGKLEIMAIFETEIQPDPMPRSLSGIRALARYRGATIGTEYAEAFMLVRETI